MKEIDWSKAPDGTTHFRHDDPKSPWRMLKDGVWHAWFGGEWMTVTTAAEHFYIARPVWSGEGLPPVGTVCEYQRNDVSYRQEWVKVTTKYFGKEMVVLEHSASGEEYVEQAASCVFRPTRTPEQIAAEELKAAIDEMSEVTQGAHDWLQAFQKLHLAGYRKVTP